jgi:hypothetical protein
MGVRTPRGDGAGFTLGYTNCYARLGDLHQLQLARNEVRERGDLDKLTSAGADNRSMRHRRRPSSPCGLELARGSAAALEGRHDLAGE